MPHAAKLVAKYQSDGTPAESTSASPYLLRKKTMSPSSSTNTQWVNDRHNAYNAGYVEHFNTNLNFC